MSTQQESICCKEVDKIKDLLADPGLADAKPPCITEHPHFANVCLCRTVLTISMHRHVYHYGSSDIPKDENGYNYTYILYVLLYYFLVAENFNTWPAVN